MTMLAKEAAQQQAGTAGPPGMLFMAAKDMHGIGKLIRRMVRLGDAGPKPVAVLLELQNRQGGPGGYYLYDGDLTPDNLRAFLAAYREGRLQRQSGGVLETLTVTAAMTKRGMEDENMEARGAGQNSAPRGGVAWPSSARARARACGVVTRSLRGNLLPAGREPGGAHPQLHPVPDPVPAAVLLQLLPGVLPAHGGGDRDGRAGGAGAEDAVSGGGGWGRQNAAAALLLRGIGGRFLQRQSPGALRRAAWRRRSSSLVA